MTDDRDLEGFDPYDLFDDEAARLYRFFTSIDAATWSRPSRCEGWSVRDVLGHLRADEDYFRACLEERVGEFIAEMGAAGATDLDSSNQIGVDTYASTANDALVEEWRTINAETRKRFRERDGGDVDSSAGTYPARWQAFHLAHELATHADDIGVPVMPDEEPARTNWRAALSRFALKEVHPDFEAVAADDASTRVVTDAGDVTLTNEDFVEAVAARIGDDAKVSAALPAELLAALSVTP
ncbi:MAG: hypothetical protein JWL83_226 [Actinomycetia bacterium]|jgi:uncharacterized protein (TIGR03083 family)|nr:hypothetical protein [Actinomycetes bacterium]